MKNLVLFFPSRDSVSQAFEGLSEKMSLREKQMLTKIPQDRVNIYMVRSLENFYGWNSFLPQFQLNWDSWKPYNSHTRVQWDLVYGFRMPVWVTHTHPSKINEITKDKRVIESLFPEYSMQSIECTHYEDILENFDKIPSRLKVLKPARWSLWKGIFIQETIPQMDKVKETDYPYILQEFFDTSWGFYSLCSGLHDFRVVILNGEIIAKILREPATWKYISNTFQWGTLHDIFDFVIPSEIQEIVDTIDNYCKKYEHRYYSIDMWLWIDWKIKIFEINGAPWYASEHMAHKFWEYIAKNILNT